MSEERPIGKWVSDGNGAWRFEGRIPTFEEVREITKREAKLEVLNELRKRCEIIRKKAYLGTVGLSQNEQVIDDVFAEIEKLTKGE